MTLLLSVEYRNERRATSTNVKRDPVCDGERGGEACNIIVGAGILLCMGRITVVRE
jgi:hypothetical protein